MKKRELKTRKILRNIFGGISITAAAFVFQACYGTGPDIDDDVKLTGTVKSNVTNLPIKGIKVTLSHDEYYYGITDKDGNFDFYVSFPKQGYSYLDNNYQPDHVGVHFLDIDGVENGLYADTTIFINPINKKEISINVELQEKQ